MNILRLSTLSLTLAIAVMTLGYTNLAFAAKPDKCPGNPSCKVDPGTSIMYTAELRGAFVIRKRDVVLEGQDNILRSGEDVTIRRSDLASDSDEELTWDTVFAFCGLLNNTPILEFTATVAKKGWTYERPGGVGVRFRNIGSFSSTEGDLDLRLDLIGECSYSSDGQIDCDPFPPEAGSTSNIPLTHYLIHARGQPGINSLCHGITAELLVPSTLVITATAP